MTRRVLTAAATIALLVLAAAAGEAQQAEPLERAEVERLLTGDTYTQAEVADIVRRSCLIFRPTSEDLERFRSLGASEGVLDAIRSCGAEEGAAATPEVLDLTVVDASLEAPAGGSAQLRLRVDREGRPAANVPLVLDGSDSLPGVEQRLEVRSDSAGTATLRFPAGSKPATYALRVLSRGYWLNGANEVTLRVVAGAPSRVTVRPDRLELQPDRTSPVEVAVAVSDSFGNPVPRAEVQLRGSDGPAAADASWTVTTGADGTAALRIPVSELEGVRAIEASAGPTAGARLAVARPAAGPGARPAEEEAEERAAAVDTVPTPEARREPEPVEPEEPAGEEPGPVRGPEAGPPPSGPRAPSVVLAVWGGDTYDNGRDPGIRAASLTVEASESFEIWGRFDHTLAMVRPYTKRGEVDDISFFGGFETDWGSGDRFSTFVEGGRRQHAVTDVWETLGHLRQTIRFGDEEAPAFERPSIMIGGFAGSWPERTDWGVEAGFGVPTSPHFRIEGLGAVTETVAMRADPTLVAARDVRFELTGRGRFGGGWEIAPTAVVGSVSESDLGEDREGALFEGRLRVESAPIGGVMRVMGFFRIQDHPESDDFSQAALGLSFGSFR